MIPKKEIYIWAIDISLDSKLYDFFTLVMSILVMVYIMHLEGGFFLQVFIVRLAHPPGQIIIWASSKQSVILPGLSQVIAWLQLKVESSTYLSDQAQSHTSILQTPYIMCQVSSSQQRGDFFPPLDIGQCLETANMLQQGSVNTAGI